MAKQCHMQLEDRREHSPKKQVIGREIYLEGSLFERGGRQLADARVVSGSESVANESTKNSIMAVYNAEPMSTDGGMAIKVWAEEGLARVIITRSIQVPAEHSSPRNVS